MITRKSKKWGDEVNVMKSLMLEGKTLNYISGLYGITRERVRQLIKNHCEIKEGEILGKSVLTERKRKEDEVEYNKKWRVLNKEERKISLTDENWKLLRRKFLKKRNNAIRQGIIFTVNFGDIIFPTHCPIFGNELDYADNNPTNPYIPTFDKIDPNKGYIEGNVVVISQRANLLKGDASIDELESIYNFYQPLLHKDY